MLYLEKIYASLISQDDLAIPYQSQRSLMIIMLHDINKESTYIQFYVKNI